MKAAKLDPGPIAKPLLGMHAIASWHGHWEVARQVAIEAAPPHLRAALTEALNQMSMEDKDKVVRNFRRQIKEHQRGLL